MGRTNHDTVAQKQKPKHVVHFVEPDRAHDEVQLHGDGPKRQDPHEQHTRDCPEICRLPRDLPRDLVGADRCLHRLFVMSVMLCYETLNSGPDSTHRSTESEPAPAETQRHADDEPHTDQCQHGGQRHRARRVFVDQEEVKKEE